MTTHSSCIQEQSFCLLIMTIGLAGGLTKPYKGLLPAALTRSEDLVIAPLLHGGPFKRAAFYLPSFTGSPVNGSISSFIVSCSYCLSSSN